MRNNKIMSFKDGYKPRKPNGDNYFYRELLTSRDEDNHSVSQHIAVILQHIQFYKWRENYNFNTIKEMLNHVEEINGECTHTSGNGHVLTPLRLAVSLGHKDIVEFLLSHKDIDLSEKSNQDYGSLIRLAITNKKVEMFAFLLKESKINLNQEYKGNTLIRLIITEGQVEMFAVLLKESEIDLNQEHKGNTLLDSAIEIRKEAAKLYDKEKVERIEAIIVQIIDRGGMQLQDFKFNKDASDEIQDKVLKTDSDFELGLLKRGETKRAKDNPASLQKDENNPESFGGPELSDDTEHLLPSSNSPVEETSCFSNVVNFFHHLFFEKNEPKENTPDTKNDSGPSGPGTGSSPGN